MDFVELNRSFIPLGKDQEASLELGRYWSSRYGGWRSWPELLKHGRVVLLAEASSGKSEEFRHQQETLTAEGKPAFFLRIEELAEQGFEAALDATSAAAFERWRAGSEDAWFFLDSIDEARLNRKNFESALKRFAREAGTALPRAHVMISCRVSDWKGAEDRAAISRWLPAPQKPAPHVVVTPDDQALLDPIFEGKRKTQQNEDNADKPDLLVVQLAPLVEHQYRALASAASVADLDRFVAQIGEQGLDTFTERPGDVLDLASFWQSHGRFGSLAEMVEHGVSRKLKEIDPHRPDNTVLASDKARVGAERVAAALTFGKSFTLRAPGSDPDPSLVAGALDAAQILPEWTDAERGALLRRGIFAPSTYGRVRFHHRSTQEYLTAKWLERLMQSGCPRSQVHDLIFTDRYGVETVASSLRPAAAWLALWPLHSDILNEIVRREPLLLIQHGDPASLSMDVRKRMLAAFAAKQGKGEIADDRLDTRALWMFGHPDLADAVAAAWKANTNVDFRFDLLRLVRDGKIKGAAKLAAPSALKAGSDERHRVVALQAAGACEDEPTLKAAAAVLKKAPEKASAFLARSFCEVLYPKYLSTVDLLRIVERSQPPKARSIDGFAYSLKNLYEAAGATNRAKLLQGIAALCLARPFSSDYERISARYKALAEHLSEIAREEVLRVGGGSPPPHLVPMLMAVERADRSASLSGEETPRLDQLVAGNPQLNRELFWADLAEQRANGGRIGTPIRHWQVFLHGGHRSLWSINESDLPWLYQDLSNRQDEQDKRIVLSAIAELLRRSGRLEAEEVRLRSMIGASATLANDLSEYINPPPEPKEMREHREHIERHDRERAEQAAKDKESWKRFRDELQANPNILTDPANLKSWKAGVHRLHNLTRWLCDRTGKETDEAAREWRLLEEGFGRAVAEAYRDAMKALWYHVKPERPVRKPGNAITIKWHTLLAYAAVGLDAAENADWALTLSEASAKLAAKHGCYSDQGYPDWFDSLLTAFPKAVLPILKKEVEAQWRTSARGTTDYMWRFGNLANPVPQPVADMLLSVFECAEAGKVNELDRGLRVVRNLQLEQTQRAGLLKTASARIQGHVKAKRRDFVQRYVALILLLDPDAGIKQLAHILRRGPKASRVADGLAMLGVLFERHDPLAPAAVGRASVKCLEELLQLAYEVVRPEDDVAHEGSFTPDIRDHAENARNVILNQMLERPGADAFRAMQRLTSHPAFSTRMLRFKELTRGKAERDADLLAWSAEETLNFERIHTAPAKTGTDLLRVVKGCLADISHNLIKGDVTSRPLLERAQDEDEVQHWLVEQLNARSKGRFHAFREAEVAAGDKPDVIAASTSATCQVGIEVKHGGMGWTVRQLDSALSVQLAEDYLKPEYRRQGVLVVTHHKDRRWQHPATKAPMTFDDVIARLKSAAEAIIENSSGAIEVACAGINAFRDSRAAVASAKARKPKRPKRSVAKAKKADATKSKPSRRAK